MGLPHVLVRFYPDAGGRAARRTTVAVLVVSRMTRAGIPIGTEQVLLRLHAPERLGLNPDRVGRPRDGDPQGTMVLPGAAQPQPGSVS